MDGAQRPRARASPAPRRAHAGSEEDSLDQLVAGCDQEYKLLQDEKRKIQGLREARARRGRARTIFAPRRQRIEQMQLELPVLIAQLRSVSMESAAVVKWRVRAHGTTPMRALRTPNG